MVFRFSAFWSKLFRSSRTRLPVFYVKFRVHRRQMKRSLVFQITAFDVYAVVSDVLNSIVTCFSVCFYVCFTHRLHSIRARSGHPIRILLEFNLRVSFPVIYLLKLVYPFSRHSFEPQGLCSVDFGWFRKPTARFCGLSIDRGVFCLFDFRSRFLAFFSPDDRRCLDRIQGPWCTAWEARP